MTEHRHHPNMKYARVVETAETWVRLGVICARCGEPGRIVVEMRPGHDIADAHRTAWLDEEPEEAAS